jgi:hypothetical protein
LEASVLRRDPTEIQGAYYLATGVWPLLDLRSFEAVTGPKREGWLVKTVGGLIAVIGTTLLTASRRNRITPEVRKLAIGSALWLLGVDLYYAGKSRISPIYLGDAVIEVALIAEQWRRIAATESRARSTSRASVEKSRDGRWDILPGESCTPDGRDKVVESSMESFPASDPPAYGG